MEYLLVFCGGWGIVFAGGNFVPRVSLWLGASSFDQYSNAAWAGSGFFGGEIKYAST